MTAQYSAHSEWWNSDFAHRIPLDLTNPKDLPRENEPVITQLRFDETDVHPNSVRIVDQHGQEVPSQLADTEVRDGSIVETQIVFPATIESFAATYWVYVDSEDQGAPTYQGIERLEPRLDDGVKRLDTGHYILELCRGKADGTAAGKWGIRYFEAKSEGKNLIKDCGNAIGGFYGPFFTPGNGKVNPPEHTTVEVTAEVEGPVYCKYCFEGTVPPGLDPNLRDKDFKIEWEFFLDTTWFRRTYHVDEYQTEVDGMPVENKITVGDEFESGRDTVVLSQFGAKDRTYYRSGDRYANILADRVKDLLELPEEEAPDGLADFMDDLDANLMSMNWDYFWRLFCVQSNILEDDEIEAHTREIVEDAHEAVHHTGRKSDIKTESLVSVPDEMDQTIFPMNADKTVERNPDTGYAMVWYTSENVARYQIVQRPASGWVNWGTNGENEYPELPIGSTIYSGYGQFEKWEQEADRMEHTLEVKRRPTRRINNAP